MEDLKQFYGCVERVVMTKRMHKKATMGLLVNGDLPVFVTNGHLIRPGNSCLVKLDYDFDSQPTRNLPTLPTGNLISSNPGKIIEAHPDEYILYGLLEMYSDEQIKNLTLSKINKHFDPGKAGWVYVLRTPSDGYIITSKVSHRTGRSLDSIIIYNLPDPPRPRVMLATSEDGSKEIIEAIERKRLVPIGMEDLEILRRKK